MQKARIESEFEVTDYRTGKRWEVPVFGAGEEAVKAVRREFPRFSKIVLKGFSINGEFKRLNLSRSYYL